jgi:hypothetical protein
MKGREVSLQRSLNRVPFMREIVQELYSNREVPIRSRKQLQPQDEILMIITISGRSTKGVVVVAAVAVSSSAKVM